MAGEPFPKEGEAWAVIGETALVATEEGEAAPMGVLGKEGEVAGGGAPWEMRSSTPDHFGGRKSNQFFLSGSQMDSCAIGTRRSVVEVLPKPNGRNGCTQQC